MSTTYCLLGITLQEMASGTVHIHIMQCNKEVQDRFAIPGNCLVWTLCMFVGGATTQSKSPTILSVRPRSRRTTYRDKPIIVAANIIKLLFMRMA